MTTISRELLVRICDGDQDYRPPHKSLKFKLIKRKNLQDEEHRLIHINVWQKPLQYCN